MEEIKNYPCLILGDFNQVLEQEDKCGGREVVDKNTDDLRAFLDNGNLGELRSIGPWFTWSNNRSGSERILERLDRAFVNEEWKALFPGAFLENLPIMRSDHGPMVLNSKPAARRTKRYQNFESFWTRNEQTGLIINKVWEDPGSNHHDPSKRLSEKLHICMKHLQNWSKKSYGNLAREIEKEMKTLCLLQMQPDKIGNEGKEREARGRLDNLLQLQEDYWKQRAKTTWQVQGERNTRFFHQWATRRNG